MKRRKLLFICLILGALPIVACSSTPAATPTPTEIPATPTADIDPVAVVEDYLAALNAGDHEAAAAYLADEAVFALHLRFQRHTHPEPFEGREAILDFWQSDAWTSITIEAEDFEAEDGRVVHKCRIFAGDAMVSYGSPSSNSACVTIIEDGQISFIGDQATEQLYAGQ